eukprot:gene14625-40580_t
MRHAAAASHCRCLAAAAWREPSRTTDGGLDQRQ